MSENNKTVEPISEDPEIDYLLLLQGYSQKTAEKH
jgi:hypothetical protein